MPLKNSGTNKYKKDCYNLNNRKIGLHDPFFSEYVYHCIATASPDQINKLPTQLLTHTHNKLRIKRFADKASMEQKIEMLSRLGVDCAFFFSTPEFLSIESIKQAYANYKENNRVKDVNQMIQQRMFVFASRDVMAILGVMAMNCHAETYRINREYSTLAAAIVNAKDIDKQVKDIELTKSSILDHKLIATLLLNNLEQQDFVSGMTAYKARELKVLLYLYVRRKSHDSYTSLEAVQKRFATQYDKARIRMTLNQLNKALHIDKFPNKNQYVISATGIQLLVSYIARLVNQTLTF